MDWNLYIPLSLAMFFEYAVWGAWAPALAPRLLGPLKMTGKQTSWIYATLPLACIFAPLIGGQLADQWIQIKWILVGAHAIGAVLLFLAAFQTRFWPLFFIMFGWSICYAATMPLVNAILFENIKDVETQGAVFIWAPVAWALVGYILTGWRWIFKTEEQGRDCLFWAAILSVVMAACCCLLPGNEPAHTGKIPIVEAFGQLSNVNLLIFLIVSMVVAGLMQFYFLGTGQFMIDIGIPGKNVPGFMGIAQAVQAVATFFLMALFIQILGFKWTLLIGAGSWFLLYLIYTLSAPAPVIVVSQGLHGLAYVFFIIVGQIFMESVSPPEIRSSMQALIFAATVGVGLFFGTQLAGFVMDLFKKDEKFQWRKVWAVPCAIMLVCTLILAVAFHEPPPQRANAVNALPQVEVVQSQPLPTSVQKKAALRNDLKESLSTWLN